MSTHTVLHIGDIHLGPGARNEDRRASVRQIVTEALREPRLAAWAIPGDLNHGRMTIDDRNFLADAFAQMAQVAPVVLCYGNHDVPGDLDVFGRLRSTHPVFVVSIPKVLQLRTATGATASIAVLPYPQRAGLVAAGASSSEVGDQADAALLGIFLQWGDDLARARARGELTAFFGHVNVAGARASSGQPQIGREIELSAAHLALLGPCYKGLNHIHRPQDIFDAHFAGSTCRLDRGEAEAKRYLLVDIADDSRYTLRSCPIDVMPRYYLEGRLTAAGFTGQIKPGPDGEPIPAPTSWEGCELFVRYTFPASEWSVIDHRLVRESFPGHARLQLDPIAEQDRDLRAPAVVAAQTVRDKVIAMLTATGGTAAPSLLEKLAALEHLEADVVLGSVREKAHLLEQAATLQEVA